MRYLTVRVHYPKPESTSALLAAVKKVAYAARQFEGLIEIGAWLDKTNNRVVNITLWESEEAAVKARVAMHSKFADIPWNEWERQPADNFLNLTRVA